MFNSQKNDNRKEVKQMNRASKIKYGITSAFAAGSMAMYGGLNAFAEGEGSGTGIAAIETPINNALKEVIGVVSGVGWTVIILMIVIVGFVLLMGGDKAKDKVKSHIVAIIIGGILIAGATVFATWWQSSLSSSGFGG